MERKKEGINRERKTKKNRMENIYINVIAHRIHCADKLKDNSYEKDSTKGVVNKKRCFKCHVARAIKLLDKG